MGEPGTYNGSPLTVLVESYGQTTEQTPGVRHLAAVAYVRAVDVAQPRRNDVLTFGGVSYLVTGDPEADGQRVTWKLSLTRRAVQ